MFSASGKPDARCIADQDQRRMAVVLAEVGGTGAPLAGGWMACDESGSWADFAAGIGVDAPFTPEALAELIDFYNAHQRPAKVQLTSFSDMSLWHSLGAAGFSVDDLEHVLVREVSGNSPQIDSNTYFRELAANDDSDIEHFIDLHLEGFYPDGKAPEGMRPIMERVARAERVTAWIVERAGVAVGSAGFEFYQGVGVFFGGSVLPRYRRLGAQQAMIAHRLKYAKELGLDFVLVASTPGGPTERNALRAGFQRLYTQALLKRSFTEADRL